MIILQTWYQNCSTVVKMLNNSHYYQLTNDPNNQYQLTNQFTNQQTTNQHGQTKQLAIQDLMNNLKINLIAANAFTDIKVHKLSVNIYHIGITFHVIFHKYNKQGDNI